ncbi:heptaprenyl diphosphate synthase component 1 [Virgibacillus ndiopensis]|uniref:heptaprenyl diphosphate synthase component 1 n=1 Tax=Virgibacillus ndiopensis TaxID=2004408 RepID=UPI000C06C654|nr:heptaprenyl diphosphate synthase component 1 [Virgibacillus ndiopensis]
MITVQTSSLELENLKRSIEKTIHHTYLEKYLQKPVIDEGKLFLLASIVTNTPLTASEKQQYIITTMLVQIALDTHDLVAKKTAIDESKALKKKRQLTVLAGDYYSGLYYLLLSEIEDYQMIHVLASAIKEINEYKMQIYYREVDSFPEYIDLIKKVESLLILRVADHVQATAVKSITEDWLLTSKLLQEKRLFQNKDSSPLFDIWLGQSKSNTYTSMVTNVEAIIQENLSSMEKEVSKLPLHLSNLKSHVTNKINQFLYKDLNVEEG